MNDLLITKPFNTMFFIILALAGVFCWWIIKKYRDKSVAERKKAVIIMYSIVVLLFVLYKIALSMDMQYAELRMERGYTGFNWFGELPLNLCNLNLILIIVGLKLDSRPILGFCFFSGFLGALMALMMPPAEFVGFSIILPRMLGFYTTHIAAMLVMPILAGLNLYRPKYSDVIPVLLSFVLVAICVTGINYLFIKTGLNIDCNYFYTMNPDGIALLELLYKRIPVPYVYMLPLMAMIVPYMLIVTFCFNIIFSSSKDRR